MAEDNIDHPFLSMQAQNSTVVGTSVSSPSRNLQYFRDGPSASEVQGLASPMEARSLWNPYGLRNYGTNHMHEASLHHMRIIGAANAATAQQHYHHPIAIGSFVGSPSYEQLVGSHSHHNLEPHWGRLVSLAKDPRGCRLLKKMIDNARPQEIDMILEDLSGHLHELMKHPFGNHVILKFFQAGNISETQKKTILCFIIMDEQKLKGVCIDDQGNRVIQKMLENIRTLNMIYAVAIIYAMKPITVSLMKDVNGGYVIQQCLRLFPPECTDVILNEIAKNCVDIARDKCGCSVIQKFLDYVEGEAFSQIVNEIISNAVVLAEDPYGNYVVQFLVKMNIMEANAMLISRLRNRYVGLSMNKYASNVVEYLLQFSETKDVAIIVLELLYSLEFLNVIQDPYGNYVVQRALKCTKGFLHECLCNIILSNCENLHSHLYGKRVVASAKAFKISMYKRSQNSA
ncbi:Pumilio-like 12 [Spatholobus suberectus]|nr:Pumilio-like 12 [Spatholobus suberectus]